MASTLVADQAPACSTSGTKQEGSHELHQKHHETVGKLVGVKPHLVTRGNQADLLVVNWAALRPHGAVEPDCNSRGARPDISYS